MNFLIARNTPIYIIDDSSLLHDKSYYSYYFINPVDNFLKENIFTLKGNVFIKANEFNILDILVLPNESKYIVSDSITIFSDNRERIIKIIKKKFSIIRSAGGVVNKENKVLMISKSGKWDLPKGRINKKEKKKEAAIREVMEECNVKASMLRKICSVWYFYRSKNKSAVLKKVSWYSMSCVDDTGMKPQYREGINMVEWISYGDIKNIVSYMYKSTTYVIDTFLKKSLL